MEVESAVRLPTPEPVAPMKRKRSPSTSSRRHAALLPRPDTPDALANSALPRRHGSSDIAGEHAQQLRVRQRSELRREDKLLTVEEKQNIAKKEYEELLTKRSGGVYIPPPRFRALQAQFTDMSCKEYQRMAWDALKKSINGLINKVNISNIKYIVPELFGENLIRGRGLFCRSIMKAQAASLSFSPIFAATAAIVNTKLPQVGELLVKRLITQFRKGFKRNDKLVCMSSTTFLAQLVNQQVCDEMLVAQILLLLLNKPTDDSVEIAVNFMKESGQHLEETNGPVAMAVFDQFRHILHESSDLEKRTQYMIEVLFQVRKDRYKEYPAIKDELDLVEEEDQITHQVDLDEKLEVEDGLNIFKYDAEYQEHEEQYRKVKAEILGEESEGDDSGGDSYESSEDGGGPEDREMEIRDQTNTDLVNLRRSIYLTIKSSGGFEEACHKLMRINLPASQESELPSMIIECCSQERTFDKFYGNIAERFSKLNRLWQELFQDMFVQYYETIHRYETNRIRIIAQLFGHLLTTDAIGWQVLSAIHLNENETTSSSRIFIKFLFEELAQGLGMTRLVQRFEENNIQPSLQGVFPTDNPRNTRFSINFFTAINMGVLTEGMRRHLENLSKPSSLPAIDDASSPEAESRYTSSSGSYSSRSASRNRDRRSHCFPNSRSPSAPRSRSRPYSMSRSPTRTQSPQQRRHSRHRSLCYSKSHSQSRSVSQGSSDCRVTRRYRYTTSRSVSPRPRWLVDAEKRDAQRGE